ncbi:MAG: DMT family transporter [Gemmatimonadota bacterium]|nr:DMT family transporter [Gemmatimonadota bacterium]
MGRGGPAGHRRGGLLLTRVPDLPPAGPSPPGDAERPDDLRRAAPVLLLASLGTSSGAVLVRLAAAPAPVTAFWRLGLAIVALLPVLVLTGGWREWRRLPRRDVGLLAVAGAGLALHLIAWFRSLEYTSVASSTVLVSTTPIFVGALSAWWLRESPDRAEWVGLLLAVAGAACIGWGDLGGGRDPLLGDLLAVSAAVLGAIYFVLGRRLRAGLGIWAYAVPVYAAAAAVCAGAAVAAGDPFGGWPAGTWVAFAGLALGPTLLGHTGFNWALRHVRAYVVGVVQLLEPLGATLLAILVLGGKEVPAVTTLVGGAGILGGVWLSVRARARAGPPPAVTRI